MYIKNIANIINIINLGKFLENKNVCLVGGAKYLENYNAGNIIDKYDIRIKSGLNIIGHEGKLGSRVDVLYITPTGKKNETKFYKKNKISLNFLFLLLFINLELKHKSYLIKCSGLYAIILPLA